MTDVELLVDIRKASGGHPVDLANWPNHRQKSIVPACSMQFEVEDSKLKMDSNTSVCFDIPGSRKDRRREAADLGQDVPMLCSDAELADKDADAVADTADSYGDDPLPPPVQPPPPTPGKVPSGTCRAAQTLAIVQISVVAFLRYALCMAVGFKTYCHEDKFWNLWPMPNDHDL